LLIALGGHALSWNSFLDVALLYALVNFVGTIAVMRFFEYSNTSEERDDPGTEA
jgi:multicomponent Na+:H+ antiporter subunit F